MAMPTCPLHRSVAPETPNFGGVQSDLEPVVANEPEVARSFLQLAEVVLEGDVPLENIAKYFGWKLGNV